MQSPEAREKDLEASRRWKREHPEYWKSYVPREEQFLAETTILCWICGAEMVDEDISGICGFCKMDVSAPFKLMATQLPGQTSEWTAYFAALSNEQILELEHQLGLEKIRRTGEAAERLVAKHSDAYGEVPAHHRSPSGHVRTDMGVPDGHEGPRYTDDHLRM